MGPSKTAIFNLAAANVGCRPVSLDTEQTPVALAMNRSWDASRREALASANWSFARVREALGEIADYEPLGGGRYAYQYPSKALRVWYVYPNGYDHGIYGGHNMHMGGAFPGHFGSGEFTNFEELYVPALNTRVIASVGESAVAEYTYDVEDTTIYDPAFVTALALRLGADVANPIKGDPTLALNLSRLFNNSISEAKRLSFHGSKDHHKSGPTSTVDSRG